MLGRLGRLQLLKSIVFEPELHSSYASPLVTYRLKEALAIIAEIKNSTRATGSSPNAIIGTVIDESKEWSGKLDKLRTAIVDYHLKRVA